LARIIEKIELVPLIREIGIYKERKV